MSRFIDNGNDTITDNQTSLTWFKKDSRQMTGKWIHLEKAMKFADEKNAENFGGFNDWRVPNWRMLKPFLIKASARGILATMKSIYPLSSSPKALIAPGLTPSMVNEP